MTGQRVGYNIRVGTEEQNPERQLEGITVDRVFTDRASAKDIHRPQLTELLRFVRQGDVLVVHSMDRLARKRWHQSRSRNWRAVSVRERRRPR